ncbi:NAD dependent epimerase/dehydratase [Pleurostoma richardsiae]|uniref:NAD dependent epimerase/dehydratase n=1 Tax=Pleurostoma richardsiae TaxID=41990 RepID=A0AA38RTK1_9PEZI|nr:NAD dependent epimerase/dehydratase [Pleurostoma richardsiae]
MSSHRVLLTGANGFIAQHILADFLEAGHSVRGVVRSQARVTQLKAIFSKYADKQLDFAIVQDITAPGAFDAALQSPEGPFDAALQSPEGPFDLVVHTASPYNFREGETNDHFLNPAVKGTTGILESVARAAPSVKRVIVTSSMASIVDFAAPVVTHPAKVYTEADWSPVTWEQALSTDNMHIVYQASKKYAEKAAWEFVEQHKPGFDLVTLCPPMVYGPAYEPSVYQTAQQLNESVLMLYNVSLRPGLTEDSPVPPTGMHVYVDVRDVAQAHLLAATTPAAGGHRFVLCAEQGHMSSQRVVNILRARLPEWSKRIPRGEPDKWEMPEGAYGASSALAKEVLGLKFHTPEETIGDMGAQLIEFA